MAVRCGLTLLCAVLVSADVYLHNPRGSNNRLDDENRDRNNGNRMFDSQNNNRGGANVGLMYYYTQSSVSIEWTAQHGTGSENGNDEFAINNADFILEYMCDDIIRDGTTQKTIPEDPRECYDWDCDNDVRYGRHESFASYLKCTTRKRNMGLFTADQNLKGVSSKYTRQNPNGARRGYECPEERDYYPYWQPSPWNPIAILTDNVAEWEAKKAAMCINFNPANSGHCGIQYCEKTDDPQNPITCGLTNDVWTFKKTGKYLPNNKDECNASPDQFTGPQNQTGQLVWVENPEFDNLAKLCQSPVPIQQAAWTRPNSLGNTMYAPNGDASPELEVQTASYKWTIPDEMLASGKDTATCVIRIRYNISTRDLNSDGMRSSKTAGLKKDASGTLIDEEVSMETLDQTYNKDGDNPLMIGKMLYGLEDADLEFNKWKNNPQVEVGTSDVPIKLQLAVNTAQYGRTFQDRSHAMRIVRRDDSDVGCTEIHNLNVRGKRGNIVQTFPGTEYDFSPSELHVGVSECVHLQWTGSNTNPNNNAGQGRQGSDRHNAMLSRPYGAMQPELQDTLTYTQQVEMGSLGVSYPQYIDDQYKFIGLDKTAATDMAVCRFGGENSELDDCPTYFDAGVLSFTAADVGTYNFLCTRNNNFSNRSQKGKMKLTTRSPDYTMMLSQGVPLKREFRQGDLTFGPKTISSPTSVTFRDEDEKTIGVLPTSLLFNDNMLVCLNHDKMGVLQKPKLFEAKDVEGPWTRIKDVEYKETQVCGSVKHGGYFRVEARPNGAAISAVVIPVLLVIGVGAFCFYKRKTGLSNKYTAENRI